MAKDGWWNTTIDRCVLATFWYLKEAMPIGKLRKEIEKLLSLDIKASELQQSIARLSANEDIVQLPMGNFYLSMNTKTKMDERVQKTEKTEAIVKEKYVGRMKEIFPKADGNALWNVFIHRFLIPFVMDAGVRVYEFLGNKSSLNITTSTNFSEGLLAGIAGVDEEVFRQTIADFLNSPDAEITQFMLSYLDTYFLIAASGLSKGLLTKVSDILQHETHFIIFVDTNFVFSVLELHDNPLNETAADLMELVRSVYPRVKVEFVISPITLNEAQQTIKKYRNQLGHNKIYTPNLAEGALHTSFPGVIRTFLERVANSKTGISPADYFLPYENNLPQILESKGVNVYVKEDIEKYRLYPEVAIDREDQILFENNNYKERAKTKFQIERDVMLWHFVKDRREKYIASPLQAKYWIVTVDYRYINFDRYKVEHDYGIPVCMLPSQFIQILRMFAPRSLQFEKIILGMMRLPLLSWEFDSRAEQITIRILTKMSRFEQIDDVPPGIIGEVLTDEALRNSLSSQPEISEEEQTHLIESKIIESIVKEKENIVREKKFIEDKLANNNLKIEELRNQSAIDAKEKQLLLDELASLRNKVEQLECFESDLIELKQKNLSEECKKARKHSVMNFLFLFIALAVPYPLLLTALYGWLLTQLSLQWVVPGVTIVLAFAVAYMLVKLLIHQGKKDEWILKESWFIKISQQLRIRNLVFSTISLFWILVVELLKELAKKLFVP